MTAEVAIALRSSSGTSLSLERTQATLSKWKVVEEDSKDDESEDTSLIARPRVRRRIVSEDEAKVTPIRSSLTEPVHIPSDDETTPRDTNESIQRLFVGGFESGELGPVLDEIPFSSSVPIPSIPPLVSTPPSSVQHAEEGSSSRSLAMRSVTLEVPANNSLLRKPGGADAWLGPLIGDIEKKKMSSHSCLTLMNDIVHSTLKKTRESKKSIHEAEEIAKGAQLEAANWKEQFENAQGTIEELQESRNHLEQQKRGLTSELAVAKTSSSQFEKDKERLECCFSEQLLKSSEEIKEFKALLDKKEEYAGELVQNLTQVQADLRISSDKNDLAMWEREYELLEEKFDLEVSWTFLNSRRDALMEASQENFDLNSELAKVLETIGRIQQPLDFRSPTIEALVTKEPVNDEAVDVAVEVEDVAILAPEGEISTTQSMEAETSVTLSPLVEPNTSSPTETAPVAASSEVATVPVVVSESEINIATSDVRTPSVTS
ncbi:uncharacterized protein [Nicotiana sylvestris]|uniref:uncharacterized protein n=1 Tax=Nicotiana sylvestris TaxID=4096 RepID=UPI00388C7770